MIIIKASQIHFKIFNDKKNLLFKSTNFDVSICFSARFIFSSKKVNENQLFFSPYYFHLHSSVNIKNLQSLQRDLGHYLETLSSHPPPHLCCVKSPGAPSYSAELKAWHPGSQEQSYQKCKVLKSVQEVHPKCALHQHKCYH